MIGREVFLNQIHETVEKMVLLIEEREVVEPDLAIIHEFAEQLKEEIESLQE